MLVQIFDKYGPLGASAYIILGIAMAAINVFAFLKLIRFLFMELLPGVIEEAADAVDQSLDDMKRTRSTFYARLDSIPMDPPKRSTQKHKNSRPQPPRVSSAQPHRISSNKQLPALRESGRVIKR